MVASVFIIFYSFFCFLQKKELNIVISMMCILPFHSFISFCFIFIDGDVGLFPAWRDIASLILLIKVLINSHVKLNKIFIFLIILFFLCVSFFLLRSWNIEEKALSTYRLYLNGVCLIVSLSVMRLNNDSLKKLSKYLILISLIIGLTNIIQYFIIREPLHLFMNHYEINRFGNLAFKSVSMTIMGFERMSGFIGSPNSLGLVLAFLMIILISIYSFTSRNIAKWKRCTILLIILLNIFCFILTFSRAGWAIFFISFLLIFYFRGRILLLFRYLFFGTIVLTIIVFWASEFIPEVSEIIYGTFSGEESSAATRGDMVVNSYDELLYNPFGHGLGSSRLENGVFAESSVLNIAYEMGIFGVLLLYLIWLYSYIIIKKNGKSLIYIISLSILIASAVASFVSVNPMEWPYFYFLWGIVGLGINPSFKNMMNKKIDTLEN